MFIFFREYRKLDLNFIKVGSVFQIYDPKLNCKFRFWRKKAIFFSETVGTIDKSKAVQWICAPSVHTAGVWCTKWLLGQDCLRALRLVSVSINPPPFHIHSCIIWETKNGPVSGPILQKPSDPIATVKEKTNKTNNTKWRHNPVNNNWHSHHRENIKSRNKFKFAP